MRSLIAIAAALLSCSCMAHGKTLENNTFVASETRTVYVSGAVTGAALGTAQQIYNLAEAGNEPIDIIINSPGGYIIPGLQVISAMNIAQSRGITIRCFVPLLAASMGFQMLAECDERYALRYSLLLWHPAKTGFRGSVTWKQLLYATRELRAMERDLLDILLSKLKISKKKFYYHYRNETLWQAHHLQKISPDFITIVDDFKNVRNPFDIR